jgi:hypothetical protein
VGLIELTMQMTVMPVSTSSELRQTRQIRADRAFLLWVDESLLQLSGCQPELEGPQVWSVRRTGQFDVDTAVGRAAGWMLWLSGKRCPGRRPASLPASCPSSRGC